MRPNIETFIGCDADYREADIVLFGAPYDSTTSFRPGARFGPAAIRHESFGLETYSPYQDRDLTDCRIFDSGDLELCFGSSERALADIENHTAKILNDGKFPLLIGGEHLVTYGALRAVFKNYPELHIIQFDAHADLRDDYLGAKLSHACVMRRAHELLGGEQGHSGTPRHKSAGCAQEPLSGEQGHSGTPRHESAGCAQEPLSGEQGHSGTPRHKSAGCAQNMLGGSRIHQFCIRSGDRSEFAFAKAHTDLHPFSFDGLDALADSLKQSQAPVYLTIDLDCLDPSVFPGTGTPEAGGVTFMQLLNAVLRVCETNVIAADINELAPMLDASGVSTATACKVLRELLLGLSASQGSHRGEASKSGRKE